MRSDVVDLQAARQLAIGEPAPCCSIGRRRHDAMRRDGPTKLPAPSRASPNNPQRSADAAGNRWRAQGATE